MFLFILSCFETYTSNKLATGYSVLESNKTENVQRQKKGPESILLSNKIMFH